jgi:formylglycine-generating enzyme required for sulfatase activity
MEIKIQRALEGERLENLSPVLAGQGITDELLDHITDRDLRNIGVDKLGERRRLLLAFEAEAKSVGMMSSFQGGRLPGDSTLSGHKVAPFKIGRHAVQRDEWNAVKLWGLAKGYKITGGTARSPLHPVVQVSWYDAVKWCNAKSEKAGLLPPYRLNGSVYRSGDFGPDGASCIDWNKNANGYRLPTEAEWEWAAREGAMNCQLYAETECDSKPDAAGISNMSGDFFDWCWDCDESGPERRIRGGSWKHHIGLETFGYRSSRLPHKSDYVTGIRLAKNFAVPAKTASSFAVPS